MLTFMRWTAVIATLAAAIAVGSVAHAADSATVQIVFDGSGSMWGKMPGEAVAPKVAAARDALKASLATLPRSTQVGLVVFGHRRPGDCSDVEQVLPPLAVDPERINAPLAKLNPKGRGPLSLALRRAAQALPGSGQETLVLIHDDPDNCQDDPCAAANEIHRSKPRLAIHVIGLGMKSEDVDRMSCVAKVTGGRMFDVQAPASLPAAMNEALRLASLEAPDAGSGLRVPAPQPAARPVEAGPPGLRLAAALSDGSELLDRPVKWRVSGPTGAGSSVTEATGAFPSLSLAPGSYVVEAHIGLASARQTVEVGAQRPTRVTLPLNAGVVLLAASVFKDAPVSPTAVFSVEAQPEQGPSSGPPLWLGPAQPTELILPAGTYKVVLQDRQFRTEKSIVVPSGSQGSPALATNAGRVRLQANDQNGAPLSGQVLFTILEDDPAAPSGRREIARSAASRPEFTLPAGTYHIIARKGPAEVREFLPLRAGDDVARTLVLGLARLSLSMKLAGTTEAVGGSASYRIARADDPQSEVVRAEGPTLQTELPGGRYLLEGRLGGQNATATREVEIKAGADQSIVLEQAAANVRLKLANPQSGTAATDIFWEVRDGAGRTVWRTLGVQPDGILAAGRYVVRAETRGRRIEKSLEIKPGEPATLELTE